MAYIWPKVLPDTIKPYFEPEWMTQNILKGHGPLCDVYENNKGAFNAEGDTPAFLHCIPNGLRSMESPSFGGWGGRYIKLRNNVWMDPLPDSSYLYPTGQWGFNNSWSKQLEHETGLEKVEIRTNYFKPIWRWLDDVQNDFAARADWCVKDFASANHHPIVQLKNTPLEIKAKAGSKLKLNASKTIDPDGDKLTFKWWVYKDASAYSDDYQIDSNKKNCKLIVPKNAQPGDNIHIICEVTDNGFPALTRYKRVIINVVP